MKVALNISGTSEDTRIDLLLTAADRMIKQHVGRDLESGTYGASGTAIDGSIGDSGYYSGDGTINLILRQRPVTSVTSVYLDATGYFGDNPDGAFASGTLLVAGTDYVLRWDGTLPGAATRCSHVGIIKRIGGVWPEAWQYRRGSINPQAVDHIGNIKVTYVAGYTTVPADLKYALALVVAKMRMSAIYGGQSPISESYEDYSYSLEKAASAAASAIHSIGEVQSILGRYRDVLL